MMSEIFRQLKNQAMLFALRVKDGRKIFCVQTTECAVPCKGKQTHIQKSQTFEPTVNKSCGKLTIEGNATTTKKCMEIKKFREISLDQFVKV